MKSRSNSLLFLVFVFGVVFAFYWFGGYRSKAVPPDEQPAATRERITLFSTDAKRAKEISWRFGSTKAKLVSVNDTDWKLVEPPLVTDSTQTAGFVSTLFDLRGESKYPFAEVSRADVGLEEPSFEIQITSKENVVDKILVGKLTLDKEYYYASKEGSDFSTLLPSYAVDELKRDPYSFGPKSSPSGLQRIE
jgi:hypothetical protein